MSFTLGEMIAKHENDYSRGYTFYFVPPAGMLEDDFRFLCKSTSLPADTITVAEADWQGNKYRVATTHEYADFTVSFLSDPKDKLRKKLLEWSGSLGLPVGIHNRKNNQHGRPGTGAGYMRDFKIQHISHYDGSTILEYTMKMGWPSVIGEMALDYSSKELATFDVTFTYQWHEITG